MNVRGPTEEQRTVVLGRTGAGKTVFSVHLLSSRNYLEMPWVIIDYKGDQLISKLVEQNKIQVVDVHKDPPKKPGLYIMYPLPIIDDAAIETWLWKVWKQENLGLYIDEGYALPQRQAFDVILTQGRSKRIPVIVLYQRPVYMSRFATAQADFFAVFDQNDERDLKTTQAFIKPAFYNGQKITVYTELPPYHCLWYDVGKGVTSILTPAPDEKQILATFRGRLKTSHKNGAFI